MNPTRNATKHIAYFIHILMRVRREDERGFNLKVRKGEG